MALPEEGDPPDLHWTIDRRIPLALITTLLVQFGGFVWWFSSVESRLTVKEQRLARVEQRLAAGRQHRVEGLVERPCLGQLPKARPDPGARGAPPGVEEEGAHRAA